MAECIPVFNHFDRFFYRRLTWAATTMYGISFRVNAAVSPLNGSAYTCNDGDGGNWESPTNILNVQIYDL